MIDTQKLKQFLVKAKKSTYASGDTSKLVKNKDHSTTITYKKGDWLYHDNYFGGEPFGGREVVFFKNKPIYVMVYYGWTSERVKDFKPIYAFLQKALSKIPAKYPYRGPKLLQEKDLVYQNTFQGEIDKFSGKEIISKKDRKIFQTEYLGGFVDIK
ncbi:MAG: DUF5680 domain-containing protein [Candidatus Beckwithbacteria bacterium]|nr:hypothetical protein [Patescibacteria group bacterium]